MGKICSDLGYLSFSSNPLAAPIAPNDHFVLWIKSDAPIRFDVIQESYDLILMEDQPFHIVLMATLVIRVEQMMGQLA
jgi:hypothetical protein